MGQATQVEDTAQLLKRLMEVGQLLAQTVQQTEPAGNSTRGHREGSRGKSGVANESDRQVRREEV